MSRKQRPEARPSVLWGGGEARRRGGEPFPSNLAEKRCCRSRGGHDLEVGKHHHFFSVAMLYKGTLCL